MKGLRKYLFLLAGVVLSCSSAPKPVESAPAAGAASSATSQAASPAAPQAASPTGPTGGSHAVAKGSSVTCQHKGDIRKLAVKSAAGGGCELLYSKAGQKTSIAKSTRDMSYCESVFAKTKENLEKAGYSCGK